MNEYWVKATGDNLPDEESELRLTIPLSQGRAYSAWLNYADVVPRDSLVLRAEVDALRAQLADAEVIQKEHARMLDWMSHVNGDLENTCDSKRHRILKEINARIAKASVPEWAVKAAETIWQTPMLSMQHISRVIADHAKEAH